MTSRKLERAIEQQCVSYATTRGIQNAKLDKAKRHWPDRVFFCLRAVLLIVEFKRPGERARPGQKAVHRKLEALGFRVYVLDNFDDFKRVLDDVL